MTRRLLAALALGLATPVAAQDRLPAAPLADTALADPAREAAARALMHDLRCITCQGQSVADSAAPFAGDMRHLVRSRIAAGDAPDEVRGWLVARYGAYITYDPPFEPVTAALWLGPLAALGLGGGLAARRLRRRGAAA